MSAPDRTSEPSLGKASCVLENLERILPETLFLRLEKMLTVVSTHLTESTTLENQPLSLRKTGAPQAGVRSAA